MQAVGIICEYNPLHAGHAYLLKRARERGDTVICLMMPTVLGNASDSSYQNAVDYVKALLN